MSTLENTVKYLQAQGFPNSYIVDGLKAGVNDCQRYIDKESARDPTLRPEKERDHLDFCIRHKDELLSKIAELQA